MINIQLTDLESCNENTLRSLSVFLNSLADGKKDNLTTKQTEVVNINKQFILPICDRLDALEKEIIKLQPKETHFMPEQPKEKENSPTIMAHVPRFDECYLDSAGIPWDSRIHSRTRSKNANGTWKLMRGINPTKVEEVLPEVLERANKPIETNDLLSYAPKIPEFQEGNSPKVPVLIPDVNARGRSYVPEPTYELDLSPEVIENISREPASFIDLVVKVTNAVTEGKIRKNQINEIVQSFNVASLPMMASHLELIPVVSAAIDAFLITN